MLAKEKKPTVSFRLEGKRALITGAGRGIGRAVAEAMAAYGAHVLLLARSIQELEEVDEVIKAQGGSSEILSADVRNLPHLEAELSKREAFDILVNNAGTNRPASFLEVSERDYDDVMALNVRSVFFLTQKVAMRLVEEKKAGSLITISSQMGHVGGAKRTVYCASKWAIEGMVRAMAIELGAHGVRVNTICPTFVETAMTRPFFTDPDFTQHVMSKIALGRLAQVEDIAGAAVFLASDASAMITGSSIMVDGGWTAE